MYREVINLVGNHDYFNLFAAAKYRNAMFITDLTAIYVSEGKVYTL